MPIKRVPNDHAPVFITVVTWERYPLFQHAEERDRLLHVLRVAHEKQPFRMRAYAILPDHFHLLIQPEEGQQFVKIVGAVKANFSRLKRKEMQTAAPLRIWQDRFWDHIIRDQEDFNRHLDYIHYNPVRHGYVTRPEDWAYSTFGEWQRRGHYAPMWGWSMAESLAFGGASYLEGES